MEGHKWMSKPIIKDLSFDRKTKQGAYMLRRIHIFWKNECILEIDVTGFIHSVMPLANVGEISVHIDAGATLESLAPKKRTKKVDVKTIKKKKSKRKKKK